MRRGSTVLPEASVLERGMLAGAAGAEKARAPGAEMRRRAALMNFILVNLFDSNDLLLPTAKRDDEMVELLTCSSRSLQLVAQR